MVVDNANAVDPKGGISAMPLWDWVAASTRILAFWAKADPVNPQSRMPPRSNVNKLREMLIVTKVLFVTSSSVLTAHTADGWNGEIVPTRWYCREKAKYYKLFLRSDFTIAEKA